MKTAYILNKDTNTLHKVSYISEKVVETLDTKINRFLGIKPIDATYTIKKIH